MDKYRKKTAEKFSLPENQFRINQKAQTSKYVQDVIEIFNTSKADHVEISSIGGAISKAVKIAEIVRHTVPGLHQVIKIETLAIKDEYEPIEEGLDPLIL